MEFELTKTKLTLTGTTLLVAGLASATLKKGSPLDELDRQLSGMIRKILKTEDFKGKSDEAKLIHTLHVLPSHALLIVGTSEEKKGDLAVGGAEILRRAGAQAAKTAKQIRAHSVAFDLANWAGKGISEAEAISAIVEGVTLGAYQFAVYQEEARKKPHPLRKVQIVTKSLPAAYQKNLERGKAAAAATVLARDLVNTPARDMTPRALAAAAAKLPSPIQVKVYDPKEIEKLGMHSYLAVAQGSEHPPALIHMTYRPRTRSRGTIALVGKGITFDSGGLSLKPANSMETMKDDMSGAAAVIGVMQALAELRPSVTVHGVIAAAENMPSGSAIRPGDIVTAMNGKTIEILNTDAEGRLTLADALTFALQKKPAVVIDIATLTGACLVALGERCSGLMSNDPALAKQLQRAAERAGERLWPLPLIEEYREDLKSTIADLKNVGGRWGGTIEAGLFLQTFAEKARWAHIDIAGPSWASQEFPYEPKGGTGSMVRTLIDFILHY